MAALPSLRQLGYLVALSDTLHFTEAAKRCFVTQSTLSGGIMELERLLGGTLVERNRQQVRLTTLGEQVVSRARLLLADAHDLMRLSRELSEPGTGELHLGIIPTIAPFVLPGLWAQMQTRFPRLQLRVHEVQSHVAVEKLGQGQLDLVILALPFDIGQLLVKPVIQESLVLIHHRQDPIALQTEDWQALPLDRLILLEEGHCLRDHTLSACRISDRANHQGIEASSLMTLLQMVQAQMGFSLLPSSVLQSGLLQAFPQIQAIRVSNPPERTIALLARSSTTQHAELEALSGVIENLFRAELNSSLS